MGGPGGKPNMAAKPGSHARLSKAVPKTPANPVLPHTPSLVDGVVDVGVMASSSSSPTTHQHHINNINNNDVGWSCEVAESGRYRGFCAITDTAHLIEPA